jgi:hypothetical protein
MKLTLQGAQQAPTNSGERRLLLVGRLQHVNLNKLHGLRK